MGVLDLTHPHLAGVAEQEREEGARARTREIVEGLGSDGDTFDFLTDEAATGWFAAMDWIQSEYLADEEDDHA